MGTGAELNKTLAADATMYTLTIQGRTAAGQTPEVIASYVTSKKIAAVTAARRTGLTTADATANLDAAGYVGANYFDIANSIHLMLSARFSVAGQSASIFLALYDEAGGVIGITRDYTLTGDATFKDASSGLFIAPSEIVDVMCAAKVFPVLRTAPASGTVGIYIEGL
jgi:hypothetical protein